MAFKITPAFLRQFDPVAFLKQMKQAYEIENTRTRTMQASVDDGEDALRTALQDEITCLKKNLSGLRRQNKSLNETIKAQHDTIFEQREMIRRLRQFKKDLSDPRYLTDR